MYGISGIYKLKQGKMGAIKDLLVTGGHSILVDELSIEDKILDFTKRGISNEFENKYLSLAMDNSNFEQVIDDKYYTVYHLVLDNNDIKGHYGIIANGVLSESMSKYCFNKSNMYDCFLKNIDNINIVNNVFMVL